jgi:hypothetical protein
LTSYAAEPLFDAHLHYSEVDTGIYGPEQIITRLDRNGIKFAVVTGTPASHTANLYQHAPKRIVPFLGIYDSHDDKISWMHDPSVPMRVDKALKTGIWHGIGELHIFAQDRNSPVFRYIVETAKRLQLPLLIHGDPAVIDTVYQIAPMHPVIWAHAGTFPYPDLVADYLQRYPLLFVDLSVRNELIAPLGEIDEAWYELFLRHPDRFMIGVDTYSIKRWQQFGTVVKIIRSWLTQLPPDVARQMAYGNAAMLFRK